MINRYTRSDERSNKSVRAQKALFYIVAQCIFHISQFGYSEGYCSTCHTGPCLLDPYPGL